MYGGVLVFFLTNFIVSIKFLGKRQSKISYIFSFLLQPQGASSRSVRDP